MNILICNDDGIKAQGLIELYKQLKLFHTVYVVAPDGERSANSHMLSVRKSITVKMEDGCYSLSGSPADCVKFALQHLFLEVDLVIGGINRGSNVGSDIMYSGTCAVAREAVYLNKKAIALSLDHGETFDYTFAVDFVSRNLENMFSFLDNQTFLNVNFPNIKTPKPAKFCKIGDLRYTELFSRTQENEYMLSGKMLETEDREATDVLLLRKGHITMTPVYPFKEDVQKIKELERVTLL